MTTTTVPPHVEARMVAPHLRVRPLAEVLVEIHGFKESARILKNFIESPLISPVVGEVFRTETLRQVSVMEAAAALG